MAIAQSVIVDGEEFTVETTEAMKCTTVSVKSAEARRAGSLTVDFVPLDGSFDYDATVRYQAPSGVVADASLVAQIDQLKQLHIATGLSTAHPVFDLIPSGNPLPLGFEAFVRVGDSKGKHPARMLTVESSARALGYPVTTTIRARHGPTGPVFAMAETGQAFSLFDAAGRLTAAPESLNFFFKPGMSLEAQSVVVRGNDQKRVLQSAFIPEDHACATVIPIRFPLGVVHVPLLTPAAYAVGAQAWSTYVTMVNAAFSVPLFAMARADCLKDMIMLLGARFWCGVGILAAALTGALLLPAVVACFGAQALATLKLILDHVLG